MVRKGLPGLTAQIKDKLIQQALERRLRQAEQGKVFDAPVRASSNATDTPEQHCRFDRHQGYQQVRIISEGASRLGIASPFFKLHEGIAGASTRIDGRDCVNYASYNYLALSGHPEVSAAAKLAIDRYGTSVSASRLVSGERLVHRELEQALAAAYEVDDAITFVSGHAANVTTIGYLFGDQDLIVHDELIHNSVLQGIALSGARRLSFPHNDAATLDTILTQQRHHFQKVLVVLEGIYSMDGDYPDLPRFVAIKKRHRAFLMVDEAHSFGVMGATGRGIREHFGLRGSEVDIWMGTLSKALAGCGGYIAGEAALIEHLKFLAPGFLYSVGMSPPVAAASLAALRVIQREPERVIALQERGRYFLAQASAAGVDTGTCAGFAVIPAITGSSIKAARLSAALFERGINVQPILYPAVPEKSARLRFFISCEHGEPEIRETVAALAEELGGL
ncbi:MAG TPA: aminotransferase class I/II-fold pyridoxal phosphate-dependent enzyme [Accumulibacter sp.]|uniref:aminotransferase class I/II-fold pyridoxal phosphate-dependent enzyme n=1 Tax=Accumulibacter sp. TaxID=2053492 RepID=UPI002D16BEB3|nr:aminotransferase class I/II-fold pyridoxal phosphate-dependent enzyme [Accumulibacter sp.]HRF73652.1 aminotransferase class I/II-fold pyridoxal phosphate-dependent enzyme [Accumulibacter sp.]